jgi:hypothetical protein
MKVAMWDVPPCNGAGVAQSVQCLTTDWRTVRQVFDLWQKKEDFSSSLYVQSGSGAQPMGTESPFPGVKQGWGVTLTTHPHLVLR